MKFLAAGLVAALIITAVASAAGVGVSINKDSTLTGTGSAGSPMGLASCSVSGQAWVWNGSAFACSSTGGLSGTITDDYMAMGSGGNLTSSILRQYTSAVSLATNGNEMHFEDDIVGSATGYLNYYGAAGGLTQYRNLVIANGRGTAIMSLNGDVSGGTVTFTGTSVTFGGTLSIPGKITVTGTDPTLSSCGTSPTIVGNDTAGVVTVGTGAATECTLTFATTYTAEPACVVTQHLNSTNPLYFSAKSATAFTVTTSSSASLVGTKFNYVCFKM